MFFQDVTQTFEAVPIVDPPVQGPVTETEILLKLNDYIQPGLYKDEFRALLRQMARCLGCGMVMVQRVFEQHVCHQRFKVFFEPRPCKKARHDA